MTQVIINDIAPYTQIVSAASQTVFGTNWTANYPTDVVVYQTPVGTAPNDVTQILPTSAYSVSFIGDLQQVQVTLVTGATMGDLITITRQTPADRENLYTNTNFTPSMLNNDFSILTMVDQQAQLVDQHIAPRYNYSALIDVPIDTILPILIANQGWVKNSNNTGFIGFTYGTAAGLNATNPALPYVSSADGPFTVGHVLVAGDTLGTVKDSGTFAGGGSVTEVDTGTGLTGGPITVAGTISFASIAANSLWANNTASGAVPQVIGMAALTGADDTNVTITLSGTPDTALINPAEISLGWQGILALNRGGTNHALTASNGGIVYSDASKLDILAGTSTPMLPLLSGMNAAPTWGGSAMNMGGFQINNLATPTASTDAATKGYADSIAAGFNPIAGVYSASTANLTSYTYLNGVAGVGATLTAPGNGVFTVDGVSPPVNARFLYKDDSTYSGTANGIYTVTTSTSGSPAVLTRATDYNTPADIQPGDLVAVEFGTVNAGSSWYQTATIVAIGTTPIAFSVFFSPATYLKSANNLSDLTSVSTARGNLGYTSTPTASIFAGWDANTNLSANSFIPGYSTTATAATTTTLTVSSSKLQYFTGVTTQTVTMPVTSTLVNGQSFIINNMSTGAVTVKSSGANTIYVMPANSQTEFTCINTGVTTAAGWSFQSAVPTTGANIVSSSSCGNFAPSSTTIDFIPNLSVSITTTGGPVQLAMESDGSANPSDIYSGSGASMQIYLYNGVNVVGSYTNFSAGAGGLGFPMTKVDKTVVGTPGTYTYTAQYKIGSSTGIIQYFVLTAYEIK